MLALVDSPNSKTPDAVYSVFHHTRERVPSARYGGGYTLKPGFHASVEDNLNRWPGNYSIRDAINRREPRTVGRAVDITLSDSDMKRITGYLADAAAADDPRLAPVREFYGTLNGTIVFGRAHTGPNTDWRSSSADSSHLWHIHLSIFTPYVDDWNALAGVVSVLVGESLDDYLSGGTMERNIAEYGDSGTWVAFVQRYLQDFGAKLTRDGKYGNETTAAVKWVFVNRFGGNAADYDGRAVTDWMLRELIRRNQDQRTAAAIKTALASLPSTAPTQAQIDAAVARFLAANPVKIPTGVRISLGTVDGTLTGAGE